MGLGSMTHQLRVLDALVEDEGSTLSTHVVDHNVFNSNASTFDAFF